MANLSGQERAQYVQQMFGRIAHRYDLMNRVMTAGQDGAWRRELIRKAQVKPGSRVLDLGSGTGDIALEIFKRHPNAWPLAADFTEGMMRVGQKRTNGALINWCSTDALNLPYPNTSFDAVVSGFLMRNVSGLPRALREQYRVLKPGGRIVILDTTRPPQNLLAPFIRFHLNVIIPTLGKMIAGDSEAYTYLPDSTKGFLSAEELAREMVDAGFQSVQFKRLMLGAVALHWGVRPADA